jgi:hypothetical protein
VHVGCWGAANPTLLENGVKVLFKSLRSGSLNILTIYSENKNGDTLSMRMQDSVIFKGTLSNAIRLHKSCSPPCFL